MKDLFPVIEKNNEKVPIFTDTVARAYVVWEIIRSRTLPRGHSRLSLFAQYMRFESFTLVSFFFLAHLEKKIKRFRLLYTSTPFYMCFPLWFIVSCVFPYVLPDVGYNFCRRYSEYIKS